MSNTYWLDGEYIKKEQSNISALTHTLHYGLGAFEGVRCYCSDEGEVNIFRLQDHTNRLLESVKILGLEVSYSFDELVEVQKQVIKKSNLKNAYLRPIVFLGSDRLGLDIVGMDIHVMVVCQEWPSYFGKDAIEKGIDVMVSSYTRAHPNSLMTKSKICGGYVNGILAHDQAKKNGYQEAILMDTTGFVAEGSGQNIFLVKDDVLLTPELTCCLNGITRKTVMQIAKDNDIEIKERLITRDELYTADEIFLCGTAVEIAPVKSVDKTSIGNGSRGEITNLIQSTYFDCVKGKIEKYNSWLSRV